MASPAPVRSFFSRRGDEETNSNSETESEEEPEGLSSAKASSDDADDKEDGIEGVTAQLTLEELESFSSKLKISSLSNSIRDAARLSISNRLHSVFADAAFVRRAAYAYALPLVANERCGSWYVPA